MTSYSQFQEDTWILHNLKLPAKGTFIEVGAYDGISSSNTYGFEQEGWTGVCIEADPEVAERCRRNRKCLTVCCAIGTGMSFQRFIVNDADRGTSGLKRDDTGKTIIVPVCRLDAIIRLEGPPHLLSIDTEGTELEVWGTIGYYRPEIVIMEFWTQPHPPRSQELVDHMTAYGYREAHRTTSNLIFVRP